MHGSLDLAHHVAAMRRAYHPYCQYLVQTARRPSMPPGLFHPGMPLHLGIHKSIEMDGSHEAMWFTTGFRVSTLVPSYQIDILPSRIG